MIQRVVEGPGEQKFPFVLEQALLFLEAVSSQLGTEGLRCFFASLSSCARRKISLSCAYICGHSPAVHGIHNGFS